MKETEEKEMGTWKGVMGGAVARNKGSLQKKE